MEDKSKEQERFIYPHEAEEAAHHLKKAHHVKSDKFLHKAAKEHLQKESDALNGVLGKKMESEIKGASKKAAPKAEPKKVTKKEAPKKGKK